MLGIEYHRRNQKLTQLDLAQRVGTFQSTVSRIERGRLKPSDPLLAKIADVLGVSPAFTLLRPVTVEEKVQFQEAEA